MYKTYHGIGLVRNSSRQRKTEWCLGLLVVYFIFAPKQVVY